MVKGFDFKLRDGNYRRTKYNRRENNKNVSRNPKRKHARVLGLAPLQALMLLIFMIIMISFLIYSKVVLDKIGIDIVNYEKKYHDLVSEKIKLEMDIEANISLKNLEELARQKGLYPVQDYQVEYVSFEAKDNIEVAEKKNGIYNTVKKIFDDLLAYIK